MSGRHDSEHQTLNARIVALEGGAPATQPISATALPKFVADGGTLKEGVPATRVSGTYTGGAVTSRYRTRGTAPNETQVANGAEADYTPVAADVNYMMTYYETVTNNITGEVKTFASAAVGPILPPDPTPAGEVEAFDFTVGTTHAVAVARAGGFSTRRTGASTIAVMAANTKRYEHSATGAQIGLLCEKAVRNYFNNANNPAAITAPTASATETASYGTAPNGAATTSTRVTAAAGGGSRGISVGIGSIPSAVKEIVWVKGASGQEYVLTDPDSGEYMYRGPTNGAWQLVEEQGTATPPSNHLNWRLFNSGTAALDVEVWGVGLQPGTGYQTLVLSDGTNNTRPKEVWTVTLAVGSITRDIQIEDHLGQVQNFLSQVIPAGATWTLDADTITISPVIAALRVYTEGGIGATPPAAPAPAPAPVSGDYPVMTMVALINSMEAADDAIWGGGAKPANQASISTPINYAGCRYLSEYPRTDGLGNSDFYLVWHSLAFWLWIFRSSTWTAVGKRIQYRRMTPFVLLDGPTGTWHTGPVHENMGGQNYSVLWQGKSDLRTPSSLWTMQRAESAANGGGRSMLITENYGIEMWATDKFHTILDQGIMRRAFAGAGCAEVRVINDDGTPYYGTDAKPLVALGGDQYCSSKPYPYVSPWLAYGADGWKNRWKALDCSNSLTGGWVTVGFATVDFCFKKDGPRPPWGNYTGSWAIPSATYNLTKAQLQANPPPFVSG